MRRLVLLSLVVLLGGCTGQALEPEIALVPAPPGPEGATASTTQPEGREVSAPSVTTDSSNCAERITFEYPPVDLDSIEYVLPLGLMSDSHVTPVDHQYYQNFLEPDLEIAVYSPAAGTITDIQHMNQSVSDRPGEPFHDYRLVIEHSCSISSIFIHVGELTERIAAVAPPPGEYARVDLPVEAGETIGWFRKNVDYNVVDLGVTLGGLLVADHYRVEPWKVHTPDPFEYFVEPIRVKMVEKSLRTAEPIGGKFAYDVDGRLVGNWFQRDTNGYQGVDRERYWAGHLAVAYNYLDPSHVIVSMGTYEGSSAQFGVRGNRPDPADVTTASGAVIYELVDYDYYAGEERWDRVSHTYGLEARNYDDRVHGVVMFQLIDDRTLKVETFPGKTAAEVNGFTSDARDYER